MLLDIGRARAIVDERRRMADEALGLYGELGTATLWRAYTRRQTWYKYACELYLRMSGQYA